MRITRLGLISAVLSLVTVIAFCVVRPSADNRIALAVSKLATRPDQSQLWREAANRNAAVGISNLGKSQGGVATRQPPTTPDQPVAPRAAGIPAGLRDAVRVVSTNQPENVEVTGVATVVQADRNTQQYVLDFGKDRRVTFQARISGQAPPFNPNDVVYADYVARSAPRAVTQILAVRTRDGRNGFVRVVQSGIAPQIATVPRFGFSASQVLNSTPPSISVRVLDVPPVVIPSGGTARVGDFTVVVFGSRAITGPAARLIEGGPYAIDLIAWVSR